MKTLKTPKYIIRHNYLVNILKDNLSRFINPPFWVRKPTPKEITEYIALYNVERAGLFTMAEKEVGDSCEFIESVSDSEIEYKEKEIKKED